ncbi:MAG: hypothetical protein ACE5O2_08340 [Armatimonadota bacterium]
MPKRVPEWISSEKLLAEERELQARLDLIRRIKTEFGLGDVQREGQRVRRMASATQTPTRKDTWIEEIVKVLQERGRPLHWKELYADLRRRRPGTDWKTPRAVLRSLVRRARAAGDNRVEAVARGTYGLSAWCDSGEPEERRGALDAQQAPMYRLAMDAIRQSGRPLHGREILAHIEARGRKVGGRNPLNTLFGALSGRPELLVNLGRNTWDLREPRSGEGGQGEAAQT